jgi:hypothetical protein
MNYDVDPWPDWSDGVPWCNTNRCCKFTHHTGRCSVNNDIPASLCKPAVREMTKGLCHGTNVNPVEMARLLPEIISLFDNVPGNLVASPLFEKIVDTQVKLRKLYIV